MRIIIILSFALLLSTWGSPHQTRCRPRRSLPTPPNCASALHISSCEVPLDTVPQTDHFPSRVAPLLCSGHRVEVAGVVLLSGHGRFSGLVITYEVRSPSGSLHYTSVSTEYYSSHNEKKTLVLKMGEYLTVVEGDRSLTWVRIRTSLGRSISAGTRQGDEKFVIKSKEESGIIALDGNRGGFLAYFADGVEDEDKTSKSMGWMMLGQEKSAKKSPWDKKQYEKPIIILFGAPGTGKGTYGKRLAKDLHMPIFSVGEYLRTLVSELEPTSSLRRKIKKAMSAGKLVDKSITEAVVDRRLFVTDDPHSRGIILDGYPRTLREAEFLSRRGRVAAVVKFTLKDDVLKERLAGRRECKQCHATYNVADIRHDGYDMPPIKPKGPDPSRCDLCGGRLIRRADDRPEVVEKRLRLYHRKSAKVDAYYSKQGLAFEFEPRRGMKDYPRLKKKLERFMQKHRLI